MKVKSNLVKFTTAAVLTITGISITNATNVKTTATQVEAATKKVKINYIPGYSVNVWDNYENPDFTGRRIKHGKTVNVISNAVDASGQTWYQIGENQWIQACYTKKLKKKVVKGTATAYVQASSQGERVADLAKAAVGKAYVWGSNGPDAFDCSGLAQYVYSKAGKEISRTTYSQVKQGKQVSMQNLKPGDLLFWGSASAPYHVAIYVGNNQFVHAATPAQGVVKENLSSYFYPSVAKRVLD